MLATDPRVEESIFGIVGNRFTERSLITDTSLIRHSVLRFALDLRSGSMLGVSVHNDSSVFSGGEGETRAA